MIGKHILQLIIEHAQNYPGRIALRFLKDASGGYETYTWPDVVRLAWQGLATLKNRGLNQGDRVLLALPTSEGFVAGALGALWGGMIPTNVALPLNRLASSTSTTYSRSDERSNRNGFSTFEAEWQNLISSLAPSAIISETTLPSTDVPVIKPEELLKPTQSSPDKMNFPDPNQIAYIQFTSGSTGRPRGIALNLKGICANLEGMRWRLRTVPEDRGLTWLPMYHDMGFFGSFLLPLYCGFPLTMMDPSLFIANPLLWLRVISEMEVTITPTPVSALQTCLDLLQRRPQPHLDLSSCTQFIVGAEPIPPRLVQNFNNVLTRYGALESALRPSYGLAEVTLAATIPMLGRVSKVDWIQRESLEIDRKAVPTHAEASDAQGYVSTGIPLEGTQIQIVSENREPLPDRHVGRIMIQSSSLLIAVLEDGTLHPRNEGWLDTGDLGYFSDGELFVTGRRKDIIIKRGRNYSPDRIEDLATLVEGVHRAAAFGLYDETSLTEKVILLVETRGKYNGKVDHRDQIRLSVRSHLWSTGYEIDTVHIVPKGSLPRTTSGKIRRQHCRELFLQNAFVEE
jgi:acyl-CoA synthetase (AMP-forming)/AMP-acid ligase II